MKEYREVISFFYKCSYYNMYLDSKNKHFFLKKDKNGNLSYLTIEELLDLSFHFVEIPAVMNIEKSSRRKTIKIIPKVLIGGMATLLSSSILIVAISMYQSQERIKEMETNYQAQQNQKVVDYLSYNDSETEYVTQEELVVDTYLESEWLNYLYIYDMEYLNKAIDYDNVSVSDIQEIISKNNSISPKFKNLLYDYSNAVIEKYPDIELRVFYENLKTLEVVECDKKELIKKSLSVDSYGCYIRTENKIYVLKDYEYEKGTWAYQVIFHEFSHCMRTADWKKGDTKIRVQVEGQNFSNTITAEALNSLFAVSLFDYEEKDIAYQLQSNYHKIMIESMDNYTIEDYINHSVSYYAKKLDEFNKDDNYATVVLELIQMQYNDYHSKSIYTNPEGYYPIYEYIASMYFRKNINSAMSYSDAIKITDELITKIMYDVPEDYNIDTNYFYEYLKTYCSTIGINTNNIHK